jgi:hypothetical protein
VYYDTLVISKHVAVYDVAKRVIIFVLGRNTLMKTRIEIEPKVEPIVEPKAEKSWITELRIDTL